ncbi:MAG: NAD(P)-dependent alcohol dehydrogenase, partial [Cystobacterineae bacterium]|nr:NAD(P)-dependent alcohol dehydrogenase [Cystobacterineae bacterium]
SGIIEQLGEGVTDFKVGDKVGFSYSWCGKCEACRTGKPYGCTENYRLNFGGVQYDNTKRLHYKGQDVSSFFGQSAFATHAVIHQNNLIPAPEDIAIELIGPLGCGIQTGAGAIFNYLHPVADSSILVTGCGSVGLSCIMAAKIAGCSKIIACDIVDNRLQMALEFGATHTINAASVADVPAAVAEMTDGAGAHYAVDCTGVASCVRQSLVSVRSAGICVILGLTQELTIHVETELMGRSKTLAGLVEGLSVPQVFIPKLLNYYRQGRFPFDRLIEFYDFKDINRAFEDTKNGKVVKAVLKM